MSDYTATYSPDDNKLRLYAVSRLDAETYARVKGAGFRWAPKQELFVAPAWTPEREDLLVELAGEVGDEDTSLVDRAEERAERFEVYSDKREADAHAAHDAVQRLTDGIPLGQPILVGHHSEKHARKDAERIESGMRRAVKMWRTSKYWEDRAAGALRHAKYKERPDVRARRIKGLEADARKMERRRDDAIKAAEVWGKLFEPGFLRLKTEEESTPMQRALYLSGRTNTAPHMVYSNLVDGKIDATEARRRTLEAAADMHEHATRWLEHITHRLAYERALLAEVGGTVAQRSGPEKGGGVKCWASPRAGGWSYVVKVNKVSVTVLDNWGNGGANFTRTIPFDKLAGVMSAAEVQTERENGRLVEVGDGMGFVLIGKVPTQNVAVPAEVPTNGAAFDAMAQSLKAGVQVVSAPQLFPTPRDLAQRMADLADIQPGHRVLEPSAGTGALLGAMGGRMFGHNPECGEVVAVEINAALCARLRAEFPLTEVVCADFLTYAAGPFDRIVMNPPFGGGVDWRHILRARALLKPRGKLVAICANGPRQATALGEKVDTWEELPAGTFDGTNVRSVLLTMSAED